MAIKQSQSSVEMVKRLVKPDLQYDPETSHYRNPRRIEKILATHGTSVEGIVQLALHGRFVRPEDEIVDDLTCNEFFTTPNARYPRLGSIGMYPDHIEKITEINTDAVRESIEYAWRSDEGQGVVIGFKDQLAERGYEISYGEHGGQEVPELILSTPPSLHVVEGIYPVNAEVAQELKTRLEEL